MSSSNPTWWAFFYRDHHYYLVCRGEEIQLRDAGHAAALFHTFHQEIAPSWEVEQFLKASERFMDSALFTGF